MSDHKQQLLPLLLLVGATTLVGTSCGSSQAEKPKLSPPAKVEHAVKETELATVHITAEAEKRLKIETATIEYRDMPRSLDVNGEVVTPVGSTMTVSTPMAGTLLAGQAGSPTVGQAVRKGQSLFKVRPFVAPERDLAIQLRRDVDSLTEKVTAATQKKDRAEILANERAGSVRAFEEARAELAIAETELKGAKERLAKAERSGLESDFAVNVPSPITGVIQKVNASVGQTAASGAILVEITDSSTMWVRVPVYVGDLPGVVRGQPARIRNLGSRPGDSGRMAHPVSAPPTADAAAGTADLYYALSNPGNSLRPGERVGVSLTLRAGERSLVIPWSAVLHDTQGTAWVYENTAPQTFVRRAVEVKQVTGSLAVLGRAPQPGTKVVIVGATELFGAEFTAGK